MARLTPEEFQEKHAKRLKAAIDDMRAGVEKVTTAPGEKAAKKVDKMRARLLEKIDDGTWASRVSAVSLEEWKRKMLNKGLPRVSQGIDEAADKVRDFAAQLLPYQDSLRAKVERMPDLTLEDSIARATEWIRGMAKFKKK